MKKRLFALLLSGVILASSVPTSSFAAISGVKTDALPTTITKEDPASNSTTEPTNQGLESAIKAVKDKITIPNEYSEFNYYFYNTNSYSDSYWSLSWRNPDNSSYIQVNSDADNHITYFAKYDYTNTNVGISKYLKKELKATADTFIKKIASEISTKLEFIDASFEGTYSGNYVYNYQRENNGVDFPDNRVTVWVNSVTGEVTAASINWIYDVSVPSSKTKLTKDEAAKLIKENMKMKLIYRSDNYGIYDKSSGTTSKNAFLVYEPTEGYISVDAKTGEVYLTRSEWIDTGIVNESEKEESAADAGYGVDSVALTKEEIAKIEELKNLISKTKAIAKVTSNPYLHIDKNLKAYSATLSKLDDGSGDTSYVWYINLNDPREIDYNKETDYYRAYAYATVDAETGKILSFYSSIKSLYDEATQKWSTAKIKTDKEAGKVILEKFFATQIKDRFENSILVSQNDDYVAYYKDEVAVYGGYNYQYNRVNEGVEYPYNSIYGSVDGVTGKIYSYGSHWDTNVTFESTKGAMTPEEAMDQYLSKDGFDLKYEINVINKYDSNYTGEGEDYYDYNKAYSIEYKIRLVYCPEIYPSMISPFTGEQLDYNGEVYKVAKPYAYLDLLDTKENRNIFLLADMNIGFEGENFLPVKDITIGEINELLQKIGYGYNAEEESQSDQPITREAIAQTFITKLGLEKVSKLEGIYKTGYSDEATIDTKYLGAVAIAKGMKLMEADVNNNFNAKSNVTRIDAVNLILNFIQAQPGGIYYY